MSNPTTVRPASGFPTRRTKNPTSGESGSTTAAMHNTRSRQPQFVTTKNQSEQLSHSKHRLKSRARHYNVAVILSWEPVIRCRRPGLIRSFLVELSLHEVSGDRTAGIHFIKRIS